MINIEHQQQMFLVKWAAQLLQQTKSHWSILATHNLSPFHNLHNIFNSNVDPKEITHLSKVKSQFWRDVISTVATFNKDRPIENIHIEPLWNNKSIKYKGKPLHFLNWCKAGLFVMQDMWQNGNLDLLTYKRKSSKNLKRLPFSYLNTTHL